MNSIEFFFDGKLQRINFNDLSPTTTVLQYLRSLPGRQGTKEGCAEGDCGACTVVIAELVQNKLVYRAVNSCLVFLPALHGKWLITIEDLGTPSQIHPIQAAFIDNYASQCGFCTPGFEMALFALYKEEPNPTEEQINEAVEGNLCRCTGYRPIRDAALSLKNVKMKDTISELEPVVIQELKSINTFEPIQIDSNGQVYLMPFTIEQAIDLISHFPEAYVINGGTDTALRVTKGKEQLPIIIDLENIYELQFIRNNQEKIVIGAGTKIQDIKNFAQTNFPEFYQLLKVFGAKQIRNRATIGGNIATASPVGDLIPALMAMEAEITLISQQGERTIPLEQFIKGYRKTDLRSGELIKQVTIYHRKDYKYAFYKVSKRTNLDINTLSLSAAIKISNNTVEDVRLVYGGMAETVRHAVKAEEFLLSKQLNEQIILQAAQIAADEFTPISDARSSAEARKIMARNLIIKFFTQITNNEL